MRFFESSTIAPPRPLREVRLAAINFIADAVNRTLDLREIADNAIHAILSVTKLDGGCVYIWHESDQALRLFAHRGLAEAFVRQMAVMRKGEDATVDAALDGTTKVIADFALTPRLFRSSGVAAGFQAAVLCPIRAQGLVVGMVALGCYKAREFEKEDVDLIEVIANQIGNAMVRAELEASVRASEGQYRGLVENSDDAIYIAGPDGRPRFANSAFARVLGYQADELATIDPFTRIHPDDVETVRAAYAVLACGESVHNLEYRFCRADGQWIDLQCNAGAFSRDGHQVEEFQFVVREVTQLKQRQQQLERRNRQLSALTTLAAVANSSLNIEQIARNTLRVALDSTGMDGGGVHLLDVATRQLRLYVQIGLPDQLLEQLRMLNWGEGVAGTVAATGEPKVYHDLVAEAPMARPAAGQAGFKSLIVVPVKAKGELLGTLGLISKQALQFTPEAVEMITAMGHQLGIALANARLYEAQLRENEKLNALLDISGVGAQRLELESLLQRILTNSVTLLSADAAYMVRYDGEQAEVVAASKEFAGLVGLRYPSAEGLSGRIRSLGQGKIFSREEVTAMDYRPMLQDAHVRSVLVAPLISRNELIGALAFVRGPQNVRDFTQADLDLMEAFAGRAALAIDNVQLLKDLSHKNRLLELLIEEAHHRIKNNLQMISGLLQLESETAADGTLSDRLRQAIARIQAIGQVHNLLSQEMPEKVDAFTLINTIIGTLISSAPMAEATPQVALELEHLWLSADQAVALALVVNELVSNSLLHGRPADGERLQVRVLCREQDGQVRLVVCDNGGGLEHDVERLRGGQGMKIVSQLAQVNLRGKLEIANRDAGVCAELQFGMSGHAPASRVRGIAPDGGHA